MSRRFGWIIIGEDLKSRETEIIGFLRSDEPVSEKQMPAANHIMEKVDDDKELRIGFDGTISFIQGQFDFDLSEDQINEMLRRYSEGTFAIWLAVEGTSNSHIYRKYQNGTLEQSFESYESEVARAKCKGPQPAKNEYGQVDEWALVELLKDVGIKYDDLRSMTLRVLSFPQGLSTMPTTPDRAPKKWWAFWR